MNIIQMYDAQADSINIDDIAANDNNRIMLNRMKRNSEDDDYNQAIFIQDHYDNNGEYCEDYVPEGTRDMGWLGYFVAKNEQLRELNFRCLRPPSGASFEELLKPFLMGVNNNRSIRELYFYDMDLLDGKIFTVLGPFFENSPTFTNLAIHECRLEDDGWRLLALAIGSSKNQSLKTVSLSRNNISDEAFADIITSMSMHPRIEEVHLNGNRLGKNGCITLATLLKCSCTELKTLNLTNNEIDDEGIDALVPALENCIHLGILKLDDNTSISLRGWQQLASVLEAPDSSLTTLSIEENNVDDEVVAIFTSALSSNFTLGTLRIGEISTSRHRWSAFSKLLCDTSSINATYLSNHTLHYLGPIQNEDPIKALLDLNQRYDNEKEVAMIKILQHHNNFDMMPFFEWEFKVLPLVINWFEKASSITMPRGFEPNIGPRKLSSVYQFVRGMPLLYVETCIKKELEDIKLKETQLNEEHLEIEKRRLELRHQQLVLDMKQQQFEQRKQSVKDHKESLLEKLRR